MSVLFLLNYGIRLLVSIFNMNIVGIYFEIFDGKSWISCCDQNALYYNINQGSRIKYILNNKIKPKYKLLKEDDFIFDQKTIFCNILKEYITVDNYYVKI